MTDAQWKVEVQHTTVELHFKERAFRKKCVTQGLVTIGRENGSRYYTVRYRDRYVCTLFNDIGDRLILSAAWNVIEISEQLMKEVEGV